MNRVRSLSLDSGEGDVSDSGTLHAEVSVQRS